MRILSLAFVAVIALSGCDGADSPPETPAGAEPVDTEILRERSSGAQRQLAGQQTAGVDHPGAKVFAEYCATCHLGGVDRAPYISALQMLPYQSMLNTLNNGVMMEQSAELSEQERTDVAIFLTGGPKEGADAPLPAMCMGEAAEFDWNEPPFATGWGIDPQNSRFIPEEIAGLTASDLPALELKWSFAYPGANRARSQPSFIGGSLIVGSQDGRVFALDADTGCLRWIFTANAEVRTGMTFTSWPAGDQPGEPPLAFFSDIVARTYAVNAVTGELVWSVKVDDHPNATATAQPTLYEGVLYQPVSSLEVVPAIDPTYPCCTFRGSIVALDGATGEIKWKTETITEPLEQTRINAVGVPNYGPSGAPIWNSPTVDEKRRLIYAGTGENYSSPAQGSSDAIIAFSIDTGEIAWIRQTTEGDAWNVACQPEQADGANCPEEEGPDVDFAAPPILMNVDGKDILVAAQKSGEAHGINPDNGELVWSRPVGRGGTQGGTHFGIATDGETVFVPMSDYDDNILPVEDALPGVFGLDPATGEEKWRYIAIDNCGERENCDPGVSAPATAIEGAVLVGYMDGILRAHDAKSGDVIWEFDSDKTFTTLSGAEARGGSFGGGSGPIAYKGRLYANSGYGIYFHMPGNVLLVFGPREGAD